MKNSSPFPMKSKGVLVGSLMLLAAGIYFGGVQLLTEEQEVIAFNQQADSFSQGTPIEFVSQGDESAPSGSDLVATYTKLYGKYQVKAFANHKFSMPSDQEIEALRLEATSLDQLYSKMTAEERKKIKRVSFPYAQFEVDGKISYKKFVDLTPAERELLSC